MLFFFLLNVVGVSIIQGMKSPTIRPNTNKGKVSNTTNNTPIPINFFIIINFKINNIKPNKVGMEKKLEGYWGLWENLSFPYYYKNFFYYLCIYAQEDYKDKQTN